MQDAGDLQRWSERVREARELEPGQAAALDHAASPSELLSRGVALSMFAARMREAFREQSCAE